jgi:hypothetical protein
MEVDQEKVRLEAEAEELAEVEMTPEVEARLVSTARSLTFRACSRGWMKVLNFTHHVGCWGLAWYRYWYWSGLAHTVAPCVSSGCLDSN